MEPANDIECPAPEIEESESDYASAAARFFP